MQPQSPFRASGLLWRLSPQADMTDLPFAVAVSSLSQPENYGIQGSEPMQKLEHPALNARLTKDTVPKI